MRFGYTIIYVADVEATIAFYKKAFNLDCEFIHESKQYGELRTGATKLAFASEVLAETNTNNFIKNSLSNDPAGFEIALIAENVELAFQKAVEAGAVLVKSPEQKPWEQIVAYVRDLNGVLVEICSSME